LHPPPPRPPSFPYTTLFRSIDHDQFIRAEPPVSAFVGIAALVAPGHNRVRGNGAGFQAGDLDGKLEPLTRQNLAAMDQLATLDPDRKSTRLNSSHVSISYAV